MDESPALSKALEIGSKSRRQHFDWSDAEQVMNKVEEELRELGDAIGCGQTQAIREELGDVLFTLVQLARHLNVDPEEALEQANEKFLRRFNHMETLIQKDALDISNLSTEELEVYWKKVKELERKN